jgi:hypothetical protein
VPNLAKTLSLCVLTRTEPERICVCFVCGIVLLHRWFKCGGNSVATIRLSNIDCGHNGRNLGCNLDTIQQPYLEPVGESRLSVRCPENRSECRPPEAKLHAHTV